MHEIEVWVLINEAGEYEVACNQDDVESLFAGNIGGCGAQRLVCLKLKVPAPKTTVLTGTVPDTQEGEIGLAIEDAVA